MAHVTRIKANDTPKPEEIHDAPKKPKDSKPTKKAEKVAKKEKKEKNDSGKKPFILIRPFVAFGRYLRNSWRELRQVRWPNRKVTWKMVFAVFVYTAIFITFLVALDILFDWIFSLILK